MKPFEQSATIDQDFFVTKDQPIKKPTMHKSGNFKYGESKELDAKVNRIEQNTHYYVHHKKAF